MMETKQTSPQTYDLGPVDQIPPGEGRRINVGHIPVAVFRTRSGDVYATQALCPHRAGPLADGITGGGELHCPLHSYKFDLETGEPIGNECKALKTYPLEIDDSGNLRVTIEKSKARAGLDPASGGHL